MFPLEITGVFPETRKSPTDNSQVKHTNEKVFAMKTSNFHNMITKTKKVVASTRCAQWDLLCQADWVITIQVQPGEEKNIGVNWSKPVDIFY